MLFSFISLSDELLNFVAVASIASAVYFVLAFFKCKMKRIVRFVFRFQDINECAKSRDLCEEKASCINTPGSFRCDCNVGFELQEEKCIGMRANGRGLVEVGQGGRGKGGRDRNVVRVKDIRVDFKTFWVG